MKITNEKKGNTVSGLCYTGTDIISMSSTKKKKKRGTAGKKRKMAASSSWHTTPTLSLPLAAKK